MLAKKKIKETGRNSFIVLYYYILLYDRFHYRNEKIPITFYAYRTEEKNRITSLCKIVENTKRQGNSFFFY